MMLGRSFHAVLGWPKRVLRSAKFWIPFILLLIVVLIVYYALANRYTPFTTDAYVQAYVIQVAPQVEGQVVKVYVKENQRVEKGDLLFEIDARPFDHRVKRLEATEQQNLMLVAQMESELQAARAEEAKTNAEELYAKAVYEQETAIFKRDATTERRYLDAKQKYLSLLAGSAKAKAVILQKEQALQARIGKDHAVVAETRASLDTARLNLSWTKVTAPVSGYVTNLQLQPGSYVSAGKPVLTCIDADSWWIVANFRESNLEYMKPGMRANVTFRNYPGREFAGTVASVGWGVAHGQGVPSGDLPGVKPLADWVPVSQRFQVRLALKGTEKLPFRVGATGAVTVFTETESPLNPLAELRHWLSSRFDYLR